MKWISVKNKLPKIFYIEEDFDSVLITDGEEISIGYLNKGYNEDLGDKDMFDDACWTDEAHILCQDHRAWPKVTHWMPLPVKPKEE